MGEKLGLNKLWLTSDLEEEAEVILIKFADC